MRNQQELENLEQEKIALTKQYEELQKKIDYYGLDKIAEDAWPFKELINARDNVKYRIKGIKDKIENFL